MATVVENNIKSDPIVKSWVSSDIESDVKDLSYQQEKLVWARAYTSNWYKNVDMVLWWLTTFFGLTSTIIMGKVVPVYYTGEAVAVISASVLFIYTFLNSFYNWYAPGLKSQLHSQAGAAHGGIITMVTKELLLDVKDRQKADNFYDWIHKEAARINTTYPPLADSVLAKYPLKKKLE